MTDVDILTTEAGIYRAWIWALRGRKMRATAFSSDRLPTRKIVDDKQLHLDVLNERT